MILKNGIVSISKALELDESSLKNEGDYYFTATQNGLSVEIYAKPLVGDTKYIRIVEIYLDGKQCAICAKDGNREGLELVPIMEVGNRVKNEFKQEDFEQKPKPQAVMYCRYGSPTKIAAYVRIPASEDSDEVLKTQREFYSDLLSRYPDRRLTEMYADVGTSGMDKNRPEYRRMLADAKQGKFEYVIVKSIAKFGRDQTEVRRATSRLLSYGVSVYFLEEQMSTSQKAWHDQKKLQNELRRAMKEHKKAHQS